LPAEREQIALKNTAVAVSVSRRAPRPGASEQTCTVQETRNNRSTFPICAMNVWWLIQMMPIVTKLTT
jgi:hypothetical protein